MFSLFHSVDDQTFGDIFYLKYFNKSLSNATSYFHCLFLSGRRELPPQISQILYPLFILILSIREEVGVTEAFSLQLLLNQVVSVDHSDVLVCFLFSSSTKCKGVDHNRCLIVNFLP